MANTPTRPPHRRTGRSAERTRPVPRRSKSVETVREHLKLAADAVEGQLPEVAATLEELRSPFGFRMLQHDERAGDLSEDTTQNLAIGMPEPLRAALQSAAKQPGKSVSALLGKALNDRFRAVLDGEAEPVEIPRSPRNSAVERVNLNVPVDMELLARMRDQVAEIGRRLGYEAKATVPKMATALLCEEFGVAYEVPKSDLALMNMPVPPQLHAAILAGLDNTDSELRRIVEEGLRKVLAGEWEPWPVPKAAPGSTYERKLLSPYVDAELFASVRVKAAELQQTLKYRVSPQTIGTGWLANELGLEELFDEEYGLTAGTD